MLRELMSTKKSYVRYLSHELRTPLNTTFLGIGLLADEIKDSKDPDDQERFNILRRLVGDGSTSTPLPHGCRTIYYHQVCCATPN